MTHIFHFFFSAFDDGITKLDYQNIETSRSDMDTDPLLGRFEDELRMTNRKPLIMIMTRRITYVRGSSQGRPHTDQGDNNTTYVAL